MDENGGSLRVPEPAWRPRSALLRARSFGYLLALDCLAILIPFAVAAAARDAGFAEQNWFVFSGLLLPIYVLMASNMHAFAAETVQDPFRAIRKALQALLLAIGSLILLIFFLKSSASFPRLTLAIGSVGAVVLLSVCRYWFVRHLERIVGGNPFSVMLIHEDDQPVPPGDFSIVIASEHGFNPEAHDPAGYDRLAKLLQTADRVVVACSPERRAIWAAALRGANIQGEIAVPELGQLAPLGLGRHDSLLSLIVATGPLSPFDRVVKRVFDVAVASIALLALSPLLVFVALWVRFDSSGPVLFRQTRIGRGNEMFQMFKFRSMYVQQTDGAGHRSTSREDDRVTPVGRLIRRTSIDELPQLLNVLRGDMSIVGPRPHALGSRAADKLFWEVDRRYWDRHAAKPGLTGLAQIRGFRGAALVEDDLRNRLQADLEYLESWSIWRDIKIIFLTARVVLHRNAF